MHPQLKAPVILCRVRMLWRSGTASGHPYWEARPSGRRFSLEELKHLHDVLQQCSIVTDANREVVVETLRSIAGEPPPCSPCCQKFFGKCSCNYRQAAMTKMQQWCDQCCAELMIWGRPA